MTVDELAKKMRTQPSESVHEGWMAITNHSQSAVIFADQVTRIIRDIDRGVHNISNKQMMQMSKYIHTHAYMCMMYA